MVDRGTTTPHWKVPMRRTRPTPVSKSVRTVGPRVELAVGSGVKVAPELRRSVPIESRWQNALGAAMMAGIACLPIVIAAGFLAEHLAAPPVPGTIFTAVLRGPIDADRSAGADRLSGDRGAERASARVHAGF